MNGVIMQNTLLKQAEAHVEQSVKASAKDSYTKIVVAGMKYATSKGPDSILAALKQSEDPIPDIVKGVIGIVGLLRRASKGVMPVNAIIPAGMSLVLQGLDAAEKLGVLKVGAAEIDQATQMFVDEILPKLGVSKDKVAGLTSQVNGVMSDPAKMAQLKQSDQQQMGAANGNA